MKSIRFGKSDIESSRLVYGCMRIVQDRSESSWTQGKQSVLSAFEAGYTHFDHADIYGAGLSEEVFGDVLRENPGMRDNIVITSKCCIVPEGEGDPGSPKHYNASKEYIMASVEGSLARMGIEQLDMLLLHRPDLLLRADDVAETFEALQISGKVRHFGVSNFKPSQVALLQSRWREPLIANQVEINIHNISTFYDGTLDQCQELSITPMAWCPIGGVAYPAWGNTFSATEEARIKEEFARQSEKYGVDDWVIALAWLLKHPADIVPIVGSTQPSRIQAARKALDIDYIREDWYRILLARNGEDVP